MLSIYFGRIPRRYIPHRTRDENDTPLTGLLISHYKLISTYIQKTHSRHRLWPLLCTASRSEAEDGRREVAEPRQRERAVGEVEEEEPCAERVHYVVQAVGVRDAVNCGVESEGEHYCVGEEADAGSVMSVE